MPTGKEMAYRKSLAGPDPKVGIFWIDIKGRKLALIFSEPVRSIVSSPKEQFVSGDYSHYDTWEKLKRRNKMPPEWKGKEYEYVPRGRVVYDRKRRKFYAYASGKLVQKQWFRKEVILNFSLVPENTEFLSDLHYEEPKL
jgi:hypothetical protein